MSVSACVDGGASCEEAGGQSEVTGQPSGC